MDILVRKTDEIVIAHGTIIEKTEMDKYYIVEKQTHIQYINLYDVYNDITLPGEFENMKYKYNTIDEFYLNEDYQEPIYLESYVRENRDRVKVLENQMIQVISAIQDLQSRVDALEN